MPCRFPDTDEEVELSDNELDRPDPIGMSRDGTFDKLLEAAKGDFNGHELTSYQEVGIREDIDKLVSSLYQIFVHLDYLPHRDSDPQDLIIPHRYDEKVLRECVLSKYSQNERPGIESAVVLVPPQDTALTGTSERNPFQRAKELYRYFRTTMRASAFPQAPDPAESTAWSIFSQRIIYTRSIEQGRQLGVWWASVDPETGMDRYEFRIGPSSGRMVPVDPDDKSVMLRSWILRFREEVG